MVFAAIFSTPILLDILLYTSHPALKILARHILILSLNPLKTPNLNVGQSTCRLHGCTHLLAALDKLHPQLLTLYPTTGVFTQYLISRASIGEYGENCLFAGKPSCKSDQHLMNKKVSPFKLLNVIHSFLFLFHSLHSRPNPLRPLLSRLIYSYLRPFSFFIACLPESGLEPGV